eukprot:g32096.t1
MNSARCAAARASQELGAREKGEGQAGGARQKEPSIRGRREPGLTRAAGGTAHRHSPCGGARPGAGAGGPGEPAALAGEEGAGGGRGGGAMHGGTRGAEGGASSGTAGGEGSCGAGCGAGAGDCGAGEDGRGRAGGCGGQAGSSQVDAAAPFAAPDGQAGRPCPPLPQAMQE